MRGLFAKTTFLLLVIGLVPFGTMGLWTWIKAENRLTLAVVEYWLVRLAREAADALDRDVRQMRSLVEAFGGDESLADIVAQPAVQRDPVLLRRHLDNVLARHLALRSDLDLVAYVRTEDGMVLSARTRRGPLQLDFVGQTIDDLELSEGERALFANARGREPGIAVHALDWHRSQLLIAAAGPPRIPLTERSTEPSDYALSFATPLRTQSREAPGLVLVAVFNWRTIQTTLDEVARRFRAEEGKKTVRYDQGYPFLFARDCTTVIGHEKRQLYGLSMARDIDPGLAEFRDLMLAEPYGHHQYEYPKDAGKISGFARCRDVPEGFGWTVGIGLYHRQVYSDVRELGEFWVAAGATVCLVVLLLGAAFSRHLTKPILELADWARDFGRGAPRAPLAIRTRDEIQVLAEAFANMAQELADKEARLVRAEKEAAWRTMAQQVAHEIKNPLTPILLSAQNIRRAVETQHPRALEFAVSGTRTIEEQCEALHAIAKDFATFAAPRHERSPEDLKLLLEDIVQHFSRSEVPPISLSFRAVGAGPFRVLCDQKELRRLFLNLFNNAVQAFGDRGGHIAVELQAQSKKVIARVRDDGPGVAAEHAHRLFEPHFSTRSAGTGLGLAICRSIAERHDGQLWHERPSEGTGALFILELPALEGPDTSSPGAGQGD